jgi:hypothetical protein
VCIEVKTISLLQSGQVKGWSKKSSLTGRTAKSYQKWAFADQQEEWHESEITVLFDGEQNTKVLDCPSDGSSPGETRRRNSDRGKP